MNTCSDYQKRHDRDDCIHYDSNIRKCVKPTYHECPMAEEFIIPDEELDELENFTPTSQQIWEDQQAKVGFSPRVLSKIERLNPETDLHRTLIDAGLLPVNDTVKQDSSKIGRNEPCGCGSGKKYKKCCGA